MNPPDMAAPPVASVTGEPPDEMTLVIPLRAEDGMSLADYDCWLNAHVTMPARSQASAASGCI